SLAEVIAAVSRIPARHPEVEELDVNPLVPAAGDGWRALDARVLVSGGLPRAPAAPLHGRRAHERASQGAAILEAPSLVPVGARASDPRKPGSRVLAYLRRHGYPGELFLVHPTASELAGLPCYPTIEALPARPLDLACIAIPADACADA